MKYPSSYSVTPVKDAAFAARIKEIHSKLSQYVLSGEVSAYDGLPLVWYAYLCEKPAGNIVIVHGFTEFSMKYEEIIYYFLEMGYNCFIFDERSHGHSGSAVSDRRYNHVETFREYSRDLDTVIRKVVRPNAGGLKISLFSHSMGGCVSLLYLHDAKPADIDKAILSSPMVEPRMYRNIPVLFVRSSIRRSVRKDGWKAAFPHTSHFNPNPRFDLSHDVSKARFDHNLSLRLSDPNYQNSGSTNRWLFECLKVKRIIANRAFLKQIPQDILLMSAGKDLVVKTGIYRKVVANLPSCKYSLYPNSKHSIYNSDDEVLIRYWNEIFAFLK